MPTITGARASRRASTLSQAELDAGVAAAHDAGRQVAVHASTAEGMMRAVRAGADTIEHGYGGTAAVFQAMHAKGIALCPTIAASEAYARYFEKWNGQEPAPESVQENRRAFQLAMQARACRSAWAATSECSRTATTRSRWKPCSAPECPRRKSSSPRLRAMRGSST